MAPVLGVEAECGRISVPEKRASRPVASAHQAACRISGRLAEKIRAMAVVHNAELIDIIVDASVGCGRALPVKKGTRGHG